MTTQEPGWQCFDALERLGWNDSSSSESANDVAARIPYFFIEVSDQGMGMDPAAVADVFGEFCQESAGDNRLYGGAGLGLSTSSESPRSCANASGSEPLRDTEAPSESCSQNSLPGAADVAADVAAAVASQAFLPLAISLAHAQLAGQLTTKHRDPFDRMLAAQALVEGLPIVSNDEALDPFGVIRLW